jgi:hypothetical protein
VNPKAILAVVVAAIALPALAAQTASFLPQPHSAGTVVYVSGGIGQEERNALRAVAKDYNLRLAFATEGRGAYLAGAQVRIENLEGSVILDTRAEGPLFFARLPRGKYRLLATHQAGAVSQEVDLTSRDADLVLRWKVATRN